jgi:hypothetical protein
MASTSAFVPGIEAQEIDLDELSEEELTRIDLVANEDADDGVIMVVGEAVEIGANGVDYNRNLITRGLRYFFTGAIKKGHQITIHIGRAISKRIKIAGLFFKKTALKAWEDLPCAGCKIVVKTIVVMALHHIGLPLLHLIPYPDVGSHLPDRIVEISEEVKKRFVTLTDEGTPLGKLFSEFPGWNEVADAFYVFDFINKKLASFYAFPCIKLGCCPEAEAA